MSKTVYTVVAGLRWSWLPGREARIGRLAIFLHRLPGYVGWVRMTDEECTVNVIAMLGTAEHARKAQRDIAYREIERGGIHAGWVRRIGWLAGAYAFRAELDKEAGQLRIMEPVDGWDAIQPEDRPEDLPWPPPDGEPIEVLDVEPDR